GRYTVNQHPKLARRHFLQGSAGVSLALPLMSSLGCGKQITRPEDLGRVSQAATATAFPKRFLVFYMPNGNIEMPPSMNFTGSIMEPLTPFKNKLIMIEGLDLSVHNQKPGEPHQQGMAFLTGRKLNTGNQVGGDGTLAGWGSGISVDQEIAKVV